MPSVPGMQGAETHKGPHRQHYHANTPYYPYSRRHRWTPSSIQPDSLPVHCHRQVHSLVGSNPDVRCNYRDMRAGTSTPLGLMVWHTRAYGVRQSSQFTSSLWDSLSRLLEIELHHTTAYHPQSNVYWSDGIDQPKQH